MKKIGNPVISKNKQREHFIQKRNFFQQNQKKENNIKDHYCYPIITEIQWKQVKKGYYVTNSFSKSYFYVLSRDEDYSKPFRIIKECIDFFPSFQHFSRSHCLKFENVITMNFYDDLVIKYGEENLSKINFVEELINLSLSKERLLTLIYFVEHFGYKIKLQKKDLLEHELKILDNIIIDNEKKYLF